MMGPEDKEQPELAAQLRRLWEAAGRPTQRAVARAAKLGVGPQRISDWINGKHVPDKESLAALVRALAPQIRPENQASCSDLRGASTLQWEKWRKAAVKPGRQGKAQADRDQPVVDDPAVGWLFSALTERSALTLDVHGAIDVPEVPDLSPLPTYVPRAHDDQLDAAVEEACGHSLVRVLVGTSASGKTRAAWEAVGRLPEGWRLWHPVSPTPQEALSAGIAHLRPKTVVWLDEIHRYLSSELVAVRLIDLLRDPSFEPLFVLGTTRLEPWDELVADPTDDRDVHPWARTLLRGREIIVPSAFSPDDLAALRQAATTDIRLGLALECGTNEVTQFLAGTPELLRRYERAPAEMRAVIHAAMDAYRLGLTGLLPEAFLRHAAVGYMDERIWERVGGRTWFETAIAWLGRPALGVRGPLTYVPPRPDRRSVGHREYRLADQLLELGSRERRNNVPPPLLWEAAEKQLEDPATLAVMAQSAHDRAYYRLAASLAHRATEKGSGEAGALLADLAQRQGRDDVAIAWWEWSANTTADSRVTWRLARALEESGDTAGARRWWRRTVELSEGRWISDLLPTLQANAWLSDAIEWLGPATDAGHVPAIAAVARLLDADGRTAEALTWYERAATAGDPDGDSRWACRLSELERHSEAAAIWQERAELGEGLAMVHLAECQLAMGMDPMPLLEQAVPKGGKGYLKMIVPLLTRAGRVDAAVHLLRLHAGRGDFAAVSRASRWLTKLGRIEEALAVWEPLVDAGDATATWNLACLLESTGDQEAAERVLNRAAAAGSSSALHRLADLYVTRAEPDAAVVLWRSAVDADRAWAVQPLAELLTSLNRGKEAEVLVREAAARGNISCMLFLGSYLSDQDPAQAERWFRMAAENGREGARGLAEWLERTGRPGEAVDVWQSFAQHGDVRALPRMTAILQRAGDLDEVDRINRTALEMGNSFARSYAEAHEALARLGIEPGGAVAEHWVVPSPPGFGFDSPGPRLVV